ncbi:ABC transporter substrate-binding protein [Pseudochrobactrum asaccharolyticum]|uniref:ABC transporter substrate-binding protein n=1 Tax=Pseudochrobactrum asaccharolyticum TaxID=354351 RepID=UPI0040434B8E
MKLRSTAALALITGMTFGALSSVADAKSTVTFWHSFGGENGKALERLVAKFEAQNPEIDIDALYTGNYEDIVTKLQAAIPARRHPDAVILEVTRYGLFAERGVLEDLSPYLEKDPVKNDLYPFALEVGQYKGKNFIVPFNSSTPVLYYNKDIFARAGVEPAKLNTWDGVRETAITIHGKLGGEGVHGIEPMGQFARWAVTMLNGSDLINTKTGDIIIDSPATIEAYEWMTDFVKELKVTSLDPVTDEKAGKALFTGGREAMAIESTGNLGGYRKALGDNLGVAPLPCNSENCAVPIGGAGIGILSAIETEKKDAIWKFISFMTSPESNAHWFASTGYLPINKKTLDVAEAKQVFDADIRSKVAFEQLGIARGRPRPPVVTWMRTTEYDVWEQIALGQRGVKEALTEFATRAREQAAKN